MATFNWFTFVGAGPSWTDIGANTVVFSGTGGLDQPITVAAWNDETHIGNGDPGTDQCGANHANNIKFISTNGGGAGASEMQLNGGATQDLNDTNITVDENTLRIHFTDASSVATSSARFYAYDGVTTTDEATGIEAYAFEQGEGNTLFVLINDDSGNTGGDNSGERLDLTDQAAATEHSFYISVTASPESVGAKTSFDFGIALTYS